MEEGKQNACLEPLQATKLESFTLFLKRMQTQQMSFLKSKTKKK